MNKINLRLRNALKSTLNELISANTKNILCYGEDEINNKTFCQPINIEKNRLRLLSCTRLEIRALSYFVKPEQQFVIWLKQNIPRPKNSTWWQIVSEDNWLRYNISDDLCCLHLEVGKVNYYMILRYKWVSHFRTIAFKFST